MDVKVKVDAVTLTGEQLASLDKNTVNKNENTKSASLNIGKYKSVELGKKTNEKIIKESNEKTNEETKPKEKDGYYDNIV